MIRMLLRAGADVDHQDSSIRGTALTYACEEGQVEVARLLIDHGAGLGFVDEEEQRSALSWAVSEQNLELTRLLLEAGAPLEQRNRNDYTPLLTACARNAVEIAGLLLVAGADSNAKLPNQQGRGTLEEATDPELRRLLENSSAWELTRPLLFE